MLKSQIKTTLYLALGLLLLAGCGNMRDQPKLDNPYGESETFGRAAREILPEAVPVGFLREDTHLYEGMVDGELATEFPMEMSREMLEEGRELYESFCSPCHGYSGYGNGVVTQEGFTQPESFHTPNLRNAPVGQYFQAITYGKNNMYSYAARVKPEGRWAIIAYIRALQLSQRASFDDLPETLQAEFE